MEEEKKDNQEHIQAEPVEGAAPVDQTTHPANPSVSQGDHAIKAMVLGIVSCVLAANSYGFWNVLRALEDIESSSSSKKFAIISSVMMLVFAIGGLVVASVDLPIAKANKNVNGMGKAGYITSLIGTILNSLLSLLGIILFVFICLGIYRN
jgi:hypothetical protein